MSSAGDTKFSKVIDFPSLSEAERQLIRVVRMRPGERGFSVSIRVIDGRFFVTQANLEPARDEPTFGTGETFQKAWAAASAQDSSSR